MLVQTLTKRLNKHKLALLALGLFGAVMAMGMTLFMRLEYQTTSRFIIIQEQRFSDAFAQAKSAEYVSGILARVVTTDSFREAVFSQYDYIEPLFPEDTDEQRESWNDAIAVSPLKDTGILSISAYHQDPAYAETIVFAVGDTLTNNIKTYLGKGAAIEMKPIDGPITTDYPARPSFIKNAVFGLLLGIVVGVLFFGFKSERSLPVVASAVPLAPKRVAQKTMPAPRPYRAESKPRATFSASEFEAWLKKPSAKPAK